MAAQFPGQPFPHRVVIDNTIGCATGCGGPVGWGCYSLHILKRGVPAGCFPGFCTQDCYSAHIFSLPMCPYLSQYRRFFVFYQQLLFFAHFYVLPPLSPRIHHSRQRKCWVVIHSTILCTAFFIRFPNCVSANSPGKYNLAGKILSASPSKKFSSSPLLSSAHFQNLKNPFQFSPPTIAQQKYFLRQFMLWITTVVPCCYPRHNSKLPVCPPQNLSTPRVIVIQRTFCRIAPILCPSRVVIPCILLFRAQICSYSQHNALVIPHTFRLLSAAQLYLISK